ncbi:MAG: hypothetical protein ACI8ZX_001417 [Planctomycetota bacterium]|jgi:uncharacterized protein YbjT (DUF2867 family)
MKCIIVGSTGLIGNHLLQNLIEDQTFEEIIILVRRETQISSPKVKQIVFDFDDLTSYSKLNGTDVIFCCLGTTIKVAGSKENFRKVDFQYPLNMAKLVPSKQYLLVSAMGANKNSNIFYSKTKGELEDELKKLNFTSLNIFRPSQLTGNRKEIRQGEIVSEKLMNLFSFFIPKKYQLIEAETVAKAMKIKACLSANRQAKEEIKGTFTYSSDEIRQIVTNEIN